MPTGAVLNDCRRQYGQIACNLKHPCPIDTEVIGYRLAHSSHTRIAPTAGVVYGCYVFMNTFFYGEYILMRAICNFLYLLYF